MLCVFCICVFIIWCALVPDLLSALLNGFYFPPMHHSYTRVKNTFMHTHAQARTHTLKYCCHWSGNLASNCLIDLFSPSLFHSPLTFRNRRPVLSLVASGDWSNNCHSGTKPPRHVCCMTSRIGFIMTRAKFTWCLWHISEHCTQF